MGITASHKTEILLWENRMFMLMVLSSSSLNPQIFSPLISSCLCSSLLHTNLLYIVLFTYVTYYFTALLVTSKTSSVLLLVYISFNCPVVRCLLPWSVQCQGPAPCLLIPCLHSSTLCPVPSLLKTPAFLLVLHCVVLPYATLL